MPGFSTPYDSSDEDLEGAAPAGTSAAPVQSGQIETSYYPSAKLRLILRFDEFSSTAVATQAPKKPPNVRKGTTSQNSPLVASPDPTAPAGVHRFVLLPPGAPPQAGGPQGTTASADKLTYVLNGVIPKTATWTQNGIRSASTLSAKFKFIDCPLDPRTLRSVGVEYLLGTVSADDYANGAAGQTRTATQGTLQVTEPLCVVPDTYVDPHGNSRTNLRFQGFVDVWEIDWDDDGEPTISIECRDNTQLLIDVEAPPSLAISTTKPLDQAFADYLANFPNFSGLSVEYLPTTATAPVLGSALSKTAYQPQLGPAPARGGGATSKLSVWDYLTDVAGAVGHVVYVQGTTVVLQQARTLFSNSDSPARSGDPYVPRVVDGAAYPHRTFLWGKNLGSMKVRRNYSRHAPSNVEVRCYSTKRKQVLVARFPDPKAQGSQLQVRSLPGDGTTDQKWTVWRVRGVEDPAVLATIAQNIYVSVGRSEFQIELRTKNLGSFGAASLDPEVLDMLVGDTFDLLAARGEEYGTLGLTEQDLVQAAQQFLEKLGFDSTMSAAYAAAYTNAGFQTAFKLREMTVEWDAEDEGVSVELHGVNYVEVRSDAPLPGGA